MSGQSASFSFAAVSDVALVRREHVGKIVSHVAEHLA